MNTKQSKRKQDGRRGVALIIVLGFLSIMIIMAVTFLTQSRTERLVANSTLEAMRGRQLLRTALNAAMNDYSVALAARNLVMAPTNPVSGVYYDLFVSEAPTSDSGMGGRVLSDDNIELMVGEVQDWIPRRYTNAPYFAAQTVPDTAEWILVREDPSSQSRILGRYAYACFDMSGGIDANLIARKSSVSGHDARTASERLRRSVRDVPMRLLPEVANDSEFRRLRRGWKGFDSLQTLIKLTDGIGEDGNRSTDRWKPERKEIYGAGLDSELVNDLVPFSLSPFRGARYDPGSGTWRPYILCQNIGNWKTNLLPILAQFEPNWESWINEAINDYTNQSKVPIRTDYPSPKNVPMFNEVALTYEVFENPILANPGTSLYDLKVTLHFEFWYPFPSSDNDGAGTFRLNAPTVGGGIAGTGPDQLWIRIAPVPGAGPPPFVKLDTVNGTTNPGTLSVTANYNRGQPYLPLSGSTNIVYTLPIIPQVGTNPLPSGITFRFLGAKTLQPIYLIGPPPGGGNADMLPANLSFSGATLKNGDPKKMFSLEATDPRLNHDASGQWVGGTVAGAQTLGKMNSWIFTAQGSNTFYREGTNLYCRNNHMETPAELGFISTGYEWKTINLFTNPAVDILSTLVSDTNLFYTGTGGPGTNWSSTSVFYTNGTINPNTRSSNVLASAFVDMATHEVPNVLTSRIGANELSENQNSMGIVDAIVSDILVETEGGVQRDVFQAGTDWARIPAMRTNGFLAGSSYPTGLNNNQREALLRNTWGLFNPENSLFTVVVIAQTIKEGPGQAGVWNPNEDMITGERRAVALVWRDPFKTGSNLHHEMFVRMFRYLND